MFNGNPICYKVKYRRKPTEHSRIILNKHSYIKYVIRTPDTT